MEKEPPKTEINEENDLNNAKKALMRRRELLKIVGKTGVVATMAFLGLGMPGMPIKFANADLCCCTGCTGGCWGLCQGCGWVCSTCTGCTSVCTGCTGCDTICKVCDTDCGNGGCIGYPQSSGTSCNEADKESVA